MNARFKAIVRKLIPINLLIFSRNYRSRLKMQKGSKAKKMLQLEVHLADHCNLNCKSCSHFSPLVEESFMEIDDFVKDCERLAKLTDGRIKHINFLGGEPLLHTQITEFLDVARKCFPKGELTIVTNGVLLSKQSEAFWCNCRKNHVKIRISNYPIRIDWEQINSLAKYYKVVVYYFFRDGVIKWGKMKLDLHGKQPILESFRRCSQSNECINLSKGKLFTCPVPAYIHHFNKYFGANLEVAADTAGGDYIDIYKARSLHEILTFLSKPIPFCKYCAVENKRIEWALSQKNIQEWT